MKSPCILPAALAATISATLASCGDRAVADNADYIYSCDEFTVYTDSVVQGPYTARAVSPLEITTSYRSAETSGASPVARFRFSLNSRDNEMDASRAHVADVRGDTDKIYTLGSTAGENEPDEKAMADTLPQNTPWTVRLDMRPVLRSFHTHGYYATSTGDTIWADDFKGVWIAGSVEPLSWDFENLYGKDDRKLRDRGDSIYEVTLTLNPPIAAQPDPAGWKIDKVDSRYAQYSSDQVLVDALYNMAVSDIADDIRPDDTYRAGKAWDGVWTRDVSYSIYLSLAMLDPSRSINSLRAKVKDGRIIQDTGTGGAWPVSTDRVVWGIAAWEIYLSTGDRAWLAEAYDVLSASLVEDMHVAWNPDYSMMHGEQSYLDWREQTYPRWMQPADIYASMCLGTNVVFSRAFEIKELMVRELGIRDDNADTTMNRRIADGVNDNLWIPDKGYYSGYLYGQPYPVASPATDNLGQALAILWGVATPEMASSIMSRTPVQPYGTSSVFPQMADIKPYHNDAVWPFVQAFWNLAAAKAGNSAALRAGLGAIYRAAALFGTNKELFVSHNGDYRGTAVNSDAQLWSAAGNAAMVLRVIMGMDMSTRGIHFSPVIPAAFKGVKKLRNLVYRGSTVDIDITGTGDRITSFKIDGHASPDHILPADIVPGHHVVEIIMDNEPLAAATVTITPQQWMPATPSVTWTSPRTADIVPGPEGTTHGAWINGIFEQNFGRDDFNLYDARSFTTVAIASVYNDVWGFAQRPHYFMPAGTMIMLKAADYARGGTQLIADQAKAARFVELTRESNTRVEFTADIRQPGEWFVDVRYANGSGPINTENKCALRTLVVNGKTAGPIVMPQRGIGEWLSTGWSNMLKVTLAAGSNTIALEYIEPYNINMNGETNTALIESIRLIKK